MKRVLALLCALVLVFSFAGCVSVDPSAPSGNDNTSNQDTQPASDSLTENPPADTQQITFSEVVAVDNEFCTIKITGIDPDNLWGYTLKAYLENKSADKAFMFSVTSAAINGVSCDPIFASEVAAGKKSNETISFLTDTLEENGVDSFTDIELNFRVYDSNDWTADAVAEVSVHVYPYGEENATVFVREPKSTDTVLVDNEHTTVIITDYTDDNIWGYTANLFIVNKTTTSIMVTADEVSVNGFMADPFFANSVSAGNCAFSSMSWSDSIFEENGITDVENIEFTLRVYDETDWLADDFANELITLNP